MTDNKDPAHSEPAGEATSRLAELPGAVRDAAGAVAHDAAGAMTDVANVIHEHAPAVISASQVTVDRAAQQLRVSSSDTLVLGTVFSAGMASGLLLVRAPRILVALALAPALVLGGTLMGRRTAGRDEVVFED